MFGISLKKIETWEQKKKTGKLLEAAKSSKKEIRLAAIKALGSFNDEEVINQLITMLREADSDTRVEIINALGKIGNPLANEHIRTFTNDNDEKVRNAASEAIKALPHKA